MNPIEPAAIISNQSFMLNGTNSNTELTGVYMISICNINVNKTAPTRYLFPNKFTFFKDLFDLHENTKNIWNMTDVVTVIVLALSMFPVV